MTQVLVVDDDQQIAMLLESQIASMGYSVETITDSREAKDLVQREPFSMIITDLIMPHVSGLEIAKEALEAYPDTIVIVVTGHGSLETGISALRLGVYDYILKPFKLEDVEHTIKRAMEIHALQNENRALRSRLAFQEGERELIGKSIEMERVYSLIQKAARVQTTVLITGESGTGKELVARAIHRRSNRHKRAFITVNCAAIPDTLLESELFGHKRGAFTDATADRVGYFVRAHEGTMLLDEIGGMPMNLQIKLLRAIQERVIFPLGAEKGQRVDVRMIAATNADLKALIKDNRFREDLFYRLNVIGIELPPLRHRAEDIPLLVNHFVKKHAPRLGVQPKSFSTDAIRAMQAYAWPGNVRELENAVESCLALSTGPELIGIDELPAELGATSRRSSGLPQLSEDGLNLDQAVLDVERRLIIEALEASDGVKARAAKMLNIKRTTLVEKMKRMGIGGSS